MKMIKFEEVKVGQIFYILDENKNRVRYQRCEEFNKYVSAYGLYGDCLATFPRTVNAIKLDSKDDAFVKNDLEVYLES